LFLLNKNSEFHWNGWPILSDSPRVICYTFQFLTTPHFCRPLLQKPENIGFDCKGVTKLFDFGLAKQVRREDATDGTYRLTANTGSIRYMSPEVGDGWPYNFKADSYSFTMLLWEMLALEVPFESYTPQQIVNMARKWGERPKLKNEWSERLKEAMQNGWDSNFRKRPTMKDFEFILELELHESQAS
jgi:serine/threonine protein kinase